MIVRPYPKFLYALDRMLPRIDSRDKKLTEIKGQRESTFYGFQGELRADRYLRRAQLPAGTLILHDLTLDILGSDQVQIDTIVLTKSAIWVLEIKNIYGTLELEEYPARLRRTTGNGKVHYFESPIVQLNHATDALNYWLAIQDIEIPVKGAVLLASRNVDAHFPVGSPVHLVTEIPSLIRRESAAPAVVDDAAIQWIAAVLRKQEEPFHPFPLEAHFNMSRGSIYTGHLCDNCSGKLISKTNRLGVCLSCGNRQWLPFLHTLVDLFLCSQRLINNSTCQELLGVGRSMAAKLLANEMFERHGNSKAALYGLNYSKLRISQEGELILPGMPNIV